MDGTAAQDFAGVHHPRGLHRDRVRALPLAVKVELLRGLRANRGRGAFRL